MEVYEKVAREVFNYVWLGMLAFAIITYVKCREKWSDRVCIGYSAVRTLIETKTMMETITGIFATQDKAIINIIKALTGDGNAR